MTVFDLDRAELDRSLQASVVPAPAAGGRR
jgi:hypothetical protein